MQALGAADWLDAWERSHALPPALKPCAYLAALIPDGAAAAETLSIGRRDARLIELHAALFGPTLQATAACPACGERIEFELDASELRAPSAGSGAVELTVDGYRVHARLPDSRDLLAASACRDELAARQVLLERCVLSTTIAGSPAAASDVPPAVIEALSHAMAEADPQATTEIDLGCPACAHRWIEGFDIGSFLGEALDRWAERLLDQVHVLAASHGWSEREILALSPARRAQYVARIQS
jgi:hypothetical protein